MKITLINGTVLEGASLIKDGISLFLYIPGLDMKTVFDLLVDPANTSIIGYTDGGITTEYAGFTKLRTISDEDGEITAVMEKEV